MRNSLDARQAIWQAIGAPDAEPVHLSLTRQLVDETEENRLRPIGLSLNTYGTNRFFRRNARAKRQVVKIIYLPAGRNVIVEQLNADIEECYERLGLKFLGSEQLDNFRLVTFQRAYELVNTIPSISGSVIHLVRSVHILEASGDDYDVSHSDPLLPFSIFLSIPEKDIPNAAFRVMESIVHEAMHLQLTLLEARAALVSHHRPTLKSPWRSEPRPPGGVLHGIYVFTAIIAMYRQMVARSDNAEDLDYLYRRNRQIGAELLAALAVLAKSDLTPLGVSLLELLKGRLNLIYR